MSKGLKTDVIVKLLDRDYGQGEALDFDRVVVYADTGLLTAFKETEGIMTGSQDPGIANRYILLIDPRYDTNWTIEEIKAIAQIAERKTNESPRHRE